MVHRRLGSHEWGEVKVRASKSIALGLLLLGLGLPGCAHERAPAGIDVRVLDRAVHPLGGASVTLLADGSVAWTQQDGVARIHTLGEEPAVLIVEHPECFAETLAIQPSKTRGDRSPRVIRLMRVPPPGHIYRISADSCVALQSCRTRALRNLADGSAERVMQVGMGVTLRSGRHAFIVDEGSEVAMVATGDELCVATKEFDREGNCIRVQKHVIAGARVGIGHGRERLEFDLPPGNYAVVRLSRAVSRLAPSKEDLEAVEAADAALASDADLDARASARRAAAMYSVDSLGREYTRDLRVALNKAERRVRDVESAWEAAINSSVESPGSELVARSLGGVASVLGGDSRSRDMAEQQIAQDRAMRAARRSDRIEYLRTQYQVAMDDAAQARRALSNAEMEVARLKGAVIEAEANRSSHDRVMRDLDSNRLLAMRGRLAETRKKTRMVDGIDESQCWPVHVEF